jgi:hypothetical protein
VVDIRLMLMSTTHRRLGPSAIRSFEELLAALVSGNRCPVVDAVLR